MAGLREVIIYKLVDPLTCETRYAGKTVNFEKRLYAHFRDSKNMKCHSQRWINSLLLQGLKPQADIIEVTDETHWQEREIYWIAKLKAEGHRLTNHHRGGEGQRCGYTPTEEVREKIRKSGLGRKQRPEHLVELIRLAAIANTKYSPEIKQKVIEMSSSHSSLQMAQEVGLTVRQIKSIRDYCNAKGLNLLNVKNNSSKKRI